MANGTDSQCCAADICCGGDAADAALAALLRHQDGTLTEAQALEAAKCIHRQFTMLPKSWGLSPVIRQIQQHPYDDHE